MLGYTSSIHAVLQLFLPPSLPLCLYLSVSILLSLDFAMLVSFTLKGELFPKSLCNISCLLAAGMWL